MDNIERALTRDELMDLYRQNELPMNHSMFVRDCKPLLATIQDQDKTISELCKQIERFHGALQYVWKQIEDDYTDEEIEAKPLLRGICSTIREALTVSECAASSD